MKTMNFKSWGLKLRKRKSSLSPCILIDCCVCPVKILFLFSAILFSIKTPALLVPHPSTFLLTLTLAVVRSVMLRSTVVIVVLFGHWRLLLSSVRVWVPRLWIGDDSRCWARAEVRAFGQLLLHPALFLSFPLPLSLSLSLSFSLLFFLHLIVSSLLLPQSLLLLSFSFLQLVFWKHLHYIALLTALFIVVSLFANLTMKSFSVLLNWVFCVLVNCNLNHSIIPDLLSFIVEVLHVWMTECLFNS